MSKSDTRPSVSVVIPAYNYDRYLRRCLASVLRQTSLPAEVIVVDDGSTDSTKATVTATSELVRYIYQDHSGAAAARNRGIRLATGEYVAFLDADDEMEPRRLELQLEAVRAYSTPAVLAGIVIRQHDGTSRIPKADSSAFQGLHQRLLLHQVELFTASLLASRSLLVSAGLYDETLAVSEGLDLLLRLSHSARVAYVDEPLVVRHLHDSNFSELSGTDTYLRTRLQIVRRHLRETHAEERALGRRAVANVYRRVAPWYRVRGCALRALRCEVIAAFMDPSGIKTRGGLAT